MFSARQILFLATALLLLSIHGRAADEPVTGGATNASPSSGTNLESFRIISERNIFNQNRAARTARRETQRRPAVQSLSLVGTMSYAKGDFAFFDGSKPEFKKPVKAGEKIAGYEVKEVQPSRVKIGNESQEFEIKVGQHLRKEEEGEWQLSTTAASPIASAVDATNSESASPAATSSAGTPSEEEALKRLVEKRAKELNQ
jgi:hypothetical protein